MDYNWQHQPVASTSASAYQPFNNTTSTAGLPQEPGAYEDFHYHNEFNLNDDLFDKTPTQPTSPIAGANPFSQTPLPGLFDPYSFDIKPSMQQTHSHPLPPIPSPYPLFDALPTTANPSALFDDRESSAFNSFLEKFGEDQQFLFNPELPPGMPSPPSVMMAYAGTRRGEEDRRERDNLGHDVEGLNLDPSSTWSGMASSSRTSRTPVQAPSSLLGFAQPPAQQVLRSEFPASVAGDGAAPPGERGDSKTRGRSLTDDLEQHGANGRDHKLHKPNHDEANGDVRMEEGNESDDELGQAGGSGRRRPSRGQGSNASSRRRHSSTSRPAPPALPTAAPAPPGPSRPRSNSSGSTGSVSQSNKGERRAPLTEAEKRTNHILSEQRRRNQIKVGFASLVDLIAAGEAASGIAVKEPAKAEEPVAGAGRKKGGAGGAGRGRGRKGDVGGGASKSVVLQKAARYVAWLEKGNEDIEAEVRRVEGLLAGM